MNGSQQGDPASHFAVTLLRWLDTSLAKIVLVRYFASPASPKAFRGRLGLMSSHFQVEFAPTFEEQPMYDEWSWDQNPINLTCISTAIPNATLTWWYEDREIGREIIDRNYEVKLNGGSHIVKRIFFGLSYPLARPQIHATGHAFAKFYLLPCPL